MQKLEELLEEYKHELHPTTLEGILNTTMKYLNTMEDSQVKVLMYQMWKHLSGVEVLEGEKGVTQDLIKLPREVLIANHEAMNYILSKLEEGGFEIDKPLHRWVVSTIKNQERVKQGTTKLLKSLNAGESVYVGEGTVEWLESCGFEVEILPLPPYQGNLPVEDRIPSLYVKLRGKG